MRHYKRSPGVLLFFLTQAVSIAVLTGAAILPLPIDSFPGQLLLQGVVATVGAIVFAVWAYAFLVPCVPASQGSRSSPLPRRMLQGLNLFYVVWWNVLALYGVKLAADEAFVTVLWIVSAGALVASHLNIPTPHMGLIWLVLIAQAGGMVVVGGLGREATLSTIVSAAASFVLTLGAYQLHRMRARNQRWSRVQAKERQEEKNYLVQQVAQLQEANSAKSRLLAMVSHDLRQPVHALGLMLGRLRREPSLSSLRVDMDEINEVVESLSESLSTMMAVTRLNSGRVTSQAEPVSLSRLFDSLAQEFQSVAADQGLSLEVESNALDVYTDPAHLRTILNNLMGNAIKYSLRGTVRLTAELVSPERVVICVQDEGIGIPQDDLSRLFQPYVRLRYHKTLADGIGLGLAIVKQMTDIINAQIDVESEVGVGTRFMLTLARSKTPVPHKIRQQSGGVLRGLRVVVVDNDDIVLGSMASTLEELGCRVIAASGWEVLEAKLSMTMSPIELIVTDYHLDTGTSGYELIVRLRQKYGARTPAILLTGDVEIRPGTDAAAAGIVIAYKPLSYDKLARLIEEVSSRD